MRFLRVWMVVALLATSVGSWSCKQDPMVKARAAHAMEKPDETEAALKKVLAKNPKDFEARRLMADVPRFRHNYAATETALQKLWKEKGFDTKDPKKLSPEERAQRDLLEGQFNELYTDWAKALDPKKKPDEYEKVLRAGLKFRPKDPSMNRQLVEFYFNKGDALAKQDKPAEAAKAYSEVLTLVALKTRRKEARDKAKEMRHKAFVASAKKYFDDKGQKALGDNRTWDPATKTLQLKFEADVNRRWRKRREKDLDQARKQTATGVRVAIAHLVQDALGVKTNVAIHAQPKMASGDEKLGRGKYQVTVSIKYPDLVEAAFASSERERARAKAKSKRPAKKRPANGAKTAAKNGTNAGSGAATNGTAAPKAAKKTTH